MSYRVNQSINFGGEEISYALSRTARRKTVAISVGFDGVRVLAPNDLSDVDVSEFVRKKAPWVIRKRAMYSEHSHIASPKEFVSGETFHYLGRPYRLKVVPDPTAIVTRVTARGSNLIAPIMPEHDPIIAKSAVRSGLRQWYVAHANIQFSQQMRVVCQALGCEPRSISVVDQSKRWGSCDGNGRIRLNWRLVMAPISLIDYVLAHEACHILEHNHSHRFWRMLETIMPDYETRIRKLDSLGHQFTW